MKGLVTNMAGWYLNIASNVVPGIAARHGFRLMCYPARIPLKPHHKEFLNSSEKFEFMSEGFRIQGYKWGRGQKKVLFLHGWQSHSFRWKKYIDALSKDEYTVYAMDAPGHGFSSGSFLTVPLYSSVIDQLVSSLGSIHVVVSHSLGSFSILHSLYHNPSLPVDRLVLMAPPGEASDFIQIFKQTLKLTNKTVNNTVNYFEKVIRKPVDFYSTSRFAAGLNLPGIIIHDIEDMETPYKYGEMIHNAWKGSALITTQGLSHNLKSPEVIEMVKDFIQKDIHKESLAHLG